MLKKKIAILMLASTMVFTTSITAFAAANDGWTEASQTAAGQNNNAWNNWVTQWENVKKAPTEISLTPGRNATEVNFAWYSKNTEPNPKFKFGKNQDLSDAKEIPVTTQAAVTGYNSNKTTATGLVENTTYYYSYQVNGVWTSATVYKTQSTKGFSFLYVGDPQIGSSLSNTATGATTTQGQDAAVRNDSFNWNNTINTALKTNPNVSFMLSAGDQIQTSSPKSNEQDIEYAGYLSPDALKSLPVATEIGNHDSASPNYSYHFNNPNASNLGLTKAGGDYYYRYGNALFITLNTNNTNIAEHQQLIQNAISENSDAKWRIVTVHQDIYGSGEHSNEPAIVNLRYNLVPIFEANKIDVVLTGHDHTYSRSLILKGGKSSGVTAPSDFSTQFDNDANGQPTSQAYKDYIASIEDSKAVQNVTKDVTYKNGNVVDPDGILYMTADSASGSKYYQLVPHQQAYVAARWQQDIPTYSAIHVDDVSFTIDTYRTDTGEKIDNTFSIIKSVDKSSLNSLIAAGDSKTSSQASYTTASFSKLTDALTVAKAVSAKSYASTQEIADAYTNLNDAINNLQANAVTTTATNSTQGSNSAQSSSNNTVNSVSKAPQGVKTGDDFNVYPIMIIAGAAAAGLVYVNRKKIKSIMK